MGKRPKIIRRYRLTVINENTLNTLWTLRLSRVRLWCLSAACVAAFIALIFCILVLSPVSYLLPGYMRPEQRRSTVDNTLRVDSLRAVTAEHQHYIDNLLTILSGQPTDTTTTFEPIEITDTLISASDEERAFVESRLEKERNTLSVLTPVLAEGMMFRLPASGSSLAEDGATFIAPKNAPVMAIQDATVIDISIDPTTGRSSLTIQHTNDFISIYSGLSNVFAGVGRRVSAGQVLGNTGSNGNFTLSVWHRGSRADLTKLLPL